MNKTVKKISALLLALALAACFSVAAFAADSSVSYEGGAEKFVFLPGSSASETDLFDNFKGVMPGDVVVQHITVKNNYQGSDKVNLYLRAETHQDDGTQLSAAVQEALADSVSMKAFLSQLSMTVKNGDTVLYEATADQLDGLAENVLLGTFYPGNVAKLTVELKVPVELGNAYANRIGEVDWVFVAEEVNDPDPVPVVPGPTTSDTLNAALWIGVVAASMAGLMFLFLTGRKKKRDNR
jgi:hypothetical protein